MPGQSSARVAALLFDLDGTLADTRAAVYAAVREAVRRHTGRIPSDAELHAVAALPLSSQLRPFAPGEAAIAAMARTVLEVYGSLLDAVTAFPGLAPVIAELRRRGYRLAVVTSKERATTGPTLARIGMAQLFELAVTRDDVASPKPAPDPVTEACRRLGVRPEAAVMIGDSPLDILAGRAAGARTAAALWGTDYRAQLVAAAPDFTFARPEDMLAAYP